MVNPDFRHLKTEKLFEIFDASGLPDKLRETDELFEIERSNTGNRPQSSKFGQQRDISLDELEDQSNDDLVEKISN